MQHTCYFFGTFNPIHLGHLLMANQALAYFGKTLGFDTVTFVPAGNPPHRQDEPDRLDALQRIQLARQSVYGHKALRVSPIELEMAQEGAVTYTADVLLRLGVLDSFERVDKQTEPAGKNRKPVLLMGQDAFESLPTWHRADVLMQRCVFIVLARPSGNVMGVPVLEKQLAGVASGKKNAEPSQSAAFIDYHPLLLPPIGISATHIRSLCRTYGREPEMLRQYLTGLIPERSLDYFMDNRLYSVWG